MIIEGKRRENPFSLSGGSVSPLYETYYGISIPEAFFMVQPFPLKKARLSTVRLYAVASLFLIIIGTMVMYYSFNVSTADVNSGIPFSGTTPVSLKSPQWSGYVVMSNLLLRESEVTIVTGSWIVPSVDPTVNDAYSSVWVGVGGYGEGSLIQTGTAQQSVKGIVSYYAWYELLPNRAVRIQNFTVLPGDEITASVKLVDPNKNIWNVEIREITRGTSFSRNFMYRSSRLSAEWVVEAPSIGGNVTTLADFGSVTFSGGFATIANTTGAISSFPAYQLVMYDSQDVQLVDVSALNQAGSGFTVTYSKFVANESS